MIWWLQFVECCSVSLWSHHPACLPSPCQCSTFSLEQRPSLLAAVFLLLLIDTARKANQFGSQVCQNKWTLPCEAKIQSLDPCTTSQESPLLLLWIVNAEGEILGEHMPCLWKPWLNKALGSEILHLQQSGVSSTAFKAKLGEGKLCVAKDTVECRKLLSPGSSR